MAVRIDIPGIGEVEADNAASESTLRELVKLMGGAGGGSGGPQTGESNKNLKKFSKNVDEAGEAAAGFGSKLASFTGGIFNSFIAGIGSVVGMLPGLAGELVFGGDKISDFTKHLPIGPLQGLIEAVEGQTELFQDLSAVGASFGNNMFGITRAAAEASMSQRDLAELVGTNADSLRRFGVTVNDGVGNFGRLSKELRQSTAGRDLMAMGITTGELNETLIGFNDMMIVSDRRRFMSEAQLTQGTIAYQKELDAIAKLTGKSRKQLQEENNARMKDIRMQMAVSRMGTEEAARFSANLGNAASVSPRFEAALVDMADGMPTDELTKQLFTLSDTFQNQAGNIQNMSAAEFQNFMATVRDEAKARLKEMGETATGQMVGLGTGISETALAAGELGGVVRTTEEALAKEQAKRDAMTAEMTQISTTIADLRSKVILPIIESPVFQNMMDSFAGMIPSLEDSQVMFANLKKKFNEDFKPALDKLITFFKEDGLTTIQNAFTSMSGLLENFMPKVEKFYNDFMADPGKAFETHIMPHIKTFAEDAVNSLGTTVVAGLAGYLSFKTLSTLFRGIFSFAAFSNPIVLALTGALTGLFAIDNLLFDGKGTQMVKDAFNSIISGAGEMIQGLFNFDFEMPNFKDYLPRWMGGGGKPISGLFGSDAEQAAEENLPPEPDETAENTNTNESTPPQQQVAKEQLTSSGETDLALLNTTATEMRDLLKRQNTILKNMGAIS